MTNKESSEVGNLPTSPMAKRARMCEECLLGNLPTSPMAKRVRTCVEEFLKNSYTSPLKSLKKIVNELENFPGISALRAIYDAIPVNVRDNLQEVYFLHPGLQSRLFLATCGRFLFSGGLYGKLRYVSRVDYLWEHVRRNEIEMPEFVYDHDDDLEYRPMMDYGQESDHARVYAGAAVDSPVSSFSMRCIS